MGFGTYNETDLISHVQFEPRAQFKRPFKFAQVDETGRLRRAVKKDPRLLLVE